jgi:senataxin
MVVSALSRAGISSGLSNNHSQPTLSNAPSAVVYHMTCNLQILRDPRMLSIIHAYPPSDLLLGWPTDPPPAGLLILLVDENSQVRRWAKIQLSKCKIAPIPMEKFVGAYTVAIDAVAHAVSAGTRGNASSNPVVSVNNTATEASGLFGTFSYVTDPGDLWSGFCALLRLIPPELLTSSSHHNVDLRRLITGHLHDIGPRQ